MAGEYKDYYQILGISKEADDKEIKAAYRKLARKHHPDVNQGDKGSEEKFKEISEAYEVLSDKDKRQKYDMYGDQWKQFSQSGGFQSGENPGGGFGGVSGFGGLDDLFASLFGDMGGRGDRSAGFGGGFRTAGRRHDSMGSRQAVDLAVEITLEEAYRGTTRTFNLSVPEQCARCGGQGVTPAAGGMRCPVCDGTGKTRGHRGPFAQNCPQCGGTGQAISACSECKGSGFIERTRRLSDVKIPAGIKRDQRLRLAGQGANGSDIYLKVNIQPDSRFERKNDDLYGEFTVPFTVAALGGKAYVETFDGRKSVSIPPGTQSGATFRLAGLGMPAVAGGSRGNLYAKSRLSVPKDLSSRERELIKEIASIRNDEVKAGD